MVLTYHVQADDPWAVMSHPLKMAIVFFCLVFIGPGRYSVDRK